MLISWGFLIGTYRYASNYKQATDPTTLVQVSDYVGIHLVLSSMCGADQCIAYTETHDSYSDSFSFTLEESNKI